MDNLNLTIYPRRVSFLACLFSIWTANPIYTSLILRDVSTLFNSPASIKIVSTTMHSESLFVSTSRLPVVLDSSANIISIPAERPNLKMFPNFHLAEWILWSSSGTRRNGHAFFDFVHLIISLLSLSHQYG